jgi:serine/threonine-protein kinase
MSQNFGRYTVVGELGRGAMGVVYLASDPMLNRQVALKTVDLGVDDPEGRTFLRDRLLRDATAAAGLHHPGIVTVHDVFEDGTRAYVVMEYVEGDTLAAWLRTNRLPDAEMTLKVLRQMADALDYTHSRGVIHRDIKPGNVMIDAAGNARIMDFGIARISDTRTCTPTGMVVGTLEYMSPEQIRGVEVDGRADQFALAVVAYQMMTGSTLFGPNNNIATLTYKIVNETPLSPCTRNGALPKGVDAVLARALAKTPTERFKSCRDFVDALAGVLSGEPTIPLAPPPATTQPAQLMPSAPELAPQAKRFRRAVPAALVAVIGLGGALAVWKPWKRSPQPLDQVAASKPEAAQAIPNREPVEALPHVASRPDNAKPKRVVSSPPAPPKSDEPPDPIDGAEMLPPPPAPKAGTKQTPFETAFQLGHEQLRNKDYANAIQSFTKATALHPNHAPAYYSRGVAYQNLMQNELAIQDYSTAIRLAPEMAHAYAARGVCLVRLRRDADAFSDFQRALELMPELAFALNGRGGIYFRRKQYRIALADYDAAIQHNPRFAQAYLNRARAREAVGDFRGASADRQREAELRAR